MVKNKRKYGTKNYGNRMLEYDFDNHVWMWDCKFYLKDKCWYNQWTDKLAGDLDEKQQSIIANSIEDVLTIEKQHQISEQLQKCRKRRCLCKTCEKIMVCTEGCNECIQQGKTVNLRFCTIK